MPTATATSVLTVFSLPNCVQCTATKTHLTRRGVTDYEVIDLSESPDALARVRELGYASAPVVLAGDEHWSGFRPDLIDRFLAGTLAL